MQQLLPASRIRTLGFVLFLLAAMFLAVTRTAHAHESRVVGPYTFVVGFSTEPAYEGQMNGVQLRVREGEAQDAPPVEGLDATLEVEVTHISSGVSKVMALRPVFGDPGHYRNDWVPTAPGDYRFRFFGSIGEMEIDETFESSPDTFSPIEPADTLYFPEDVPASRELEGAVRGAQSSADEALGMVLGVDDQIAGARTLTIGALGLALVALLVAVLSLIIARRR